MNFATSSAENDIYSYTSISKLSSFSNGVTNVSFTVGISVYIFIPSATFKLQNHKYFTVTSPCSAIGFKVSAVVKVSKSTLPVVAISFSPCINVNCTYVF